MTTELLSRLAEALRFVREVRTTTRLQHRHILPQSGSPDLPLP
jgi:hypothetical protein